MRHRKEWSDPFEDIREGFGEWNMIELRNLKGKVLELTLVISGN